MSNILEELENRETDDRGYRQVTWQDLYDVICSTFHDTELFEMKGINKETEKLLERAVLYHHG